MNKVWNVLSSMAVLVLGAYFLTNFFLNQTSIPQQFTDSRMKGAEIARNIVALSNNSLSSLSEIARYDEAGNTPDALILISKEILKVGEYQTQALNLSQELEKMAELVKNIKPQGIKIVATEAISSEVALVSSLLIYNGYLKDLFETLKTKLESNTNTDGRVKDLVGKINYQIKTINSLNDESVAVFNTFDTLSKSK